MEPDDKELGEETLAMEQILNRVRGQVKRLLARGASAPDVTYALAFVATELGLLRSNDPAGVVAVVLKGVSQVSSDYARLMHGQDEGEEVLERAPEGVSIH
ncbi:MAG: hypothetical protein FJZ96_13760 [Chloroflexi bacterium]|nr:hypothetical protein [Chloroflexota bacterium]